MIKRVAARLFPQPFVAAVTGALALLALTTAWAATGLNAQHHPLSAEHLLLALLLAAGVAACYRYPIHIGHSHKVEMTSVPLYLMAVLLPSVPLAATAAGLGILSGEMLVRARRGNLYSDVTTATARWTIVVMAGALCHQMLADQQALAMLVAALVLWVGDTLTCPLVIAPMTGSRPFSVIVSGVKESVQVEGVQYLLGLLGALAAYQQIWALLLLALPSVLVYMAFKSVNELHSSTLVMLESMADTVDLRDPYTGGHSRRVAALTKSILRELGLTGPEADLIVTAARVHDIGKIGIPDAVLNKAGKFTPEEEAIMQTHPDRGADLLTRYRDFARGVDIVRHHHESWDGTGYPHRLKETAIPFGARVIAVADSFDAMTSDRPYRKAMPVEKAAAILRAGQGQQWDPQIVDAFLRAINAPAATPSTPAEFKFPGSKLRPDSSFANP